MGKGTTAPEKKQRLVKSFGGSMAVGKEKTKALRQEYSRGQWRPKSYDVIMIVGREFTAAAEAPR